MQDRIDISLTDFIDFATKAGTPRLSKVREICRRGPYSPATDYWRPFREHLQESLRSGTFSFETLRIFASSYPDRKKVARFTRAALGYMRFVGRKSITWFTPPQGAWSPSRLRVRINPEIGIRIRDRSYVIKLYFKDLPLTKQRVDLLTFLLRNQLSAGNSDTTFAVLDVANGKLFEASQAGRDLMPLLLGEAAAFVAMYDSILEEAA